MTALIIIYLTLFIIQRAISAVFADYSYTSILFQQVFGVFLPVLIYYTINSESYIEKSELRIKLNDIPIMFFGGFFMQFLGSFINYPVVYLLEKLQIPTTTSASIPQGSKIFLYIFLICCIPAVFEEVLFRKFTYNILKKYGKNTALFLTALIFGIVHFNLWSILSLIVAGLMLSYLVYNGYPLIYPILFHFSLNLSGIILDFIIKNEKWAEILNNYFPLFGFVSGIFIIIFTFYISKERRSNG